MGYCYVGHGTEIGEINRALFCWTIDCMGYLQIDSAVAIYMGNMLFIVDGTDQDSLLWVFLYRTRYLADDVHYSLGSTFALSRDVWFGTTAFMRYLGVQPHIYRERNKTTACS